MGKSSVLCFALCLVVVLFNGCLATRHQQQQHHQQQQQQNQCQLQNLEALEPTNRIKSEAGVTEVWDFNEDQLRCAGVAVERHTIEPNGLFLPSFVNAPKLVYIIKGRGIEGALVPGCPETYQSAGQQSHHQGREQEREQEQEQGREGRRAGQDQHQKIRNFREGDVIALPAGVSHWCYNDGNEPLVVVVLLDTSNHANQLDQNPRRFYLAGNPQQEHEQQQQGQQGQRHRGQESSGNNIFSGFDVKVLAEAFGVSTETARKLQSQNDKRGNIIRVEGGLQMVRPPRATQEEEEEERRRPWGRDSSNGLEETLCSARLRENIDDASRADIFTPHAGRISTLNSNNLPILSWLKLSAERGVLYRNAIYAPHYCMNAHSVTYVTKGRARVQIVDDKGQSVFDDEVREGQLIVEPQNFGVIKQAGNEGFEYISFKTNDNAMINTLAGRVSAIRAMPVDLLANAYQISKEDASKLKFNREQSTLFSQRSSRSERRDVA